MLLTLFLLLRGFSSDAPVYFFVLAIVAGLVVWLSAGLDKARMGRTWDHFVLIGKELGIDVQKQEVTTFFPKRPALEGNFRGFRLKLFTEQRGYGKHTYYCTMLHLYLKNENGFDFQLLKFSQAGKAGRERALSMDHADFDQKFVLSSRQPGKALAVFDARLCDRLAKFDYLFFALTKLEENKIVYEEQELINSPERARRFSMLIDCCADIAENVQREGA